MDYGYSTTSYGAQGGANGGGFMPGSQGDGGNTKKGYGNDTLRPVTIKQLLDAHHPHPDADHFMIDNSETTQVTFVGQIRNISTQTTKIAYKLDDGTGIIEVTVWVDSDEMNNASEDSSKPKPVEQGYARVWGRLKSFGGKRHVGANVIRPITDYNEISYHLLEATAVHLHFSRGPPESLGGQGTDGGMGGKQDGQGVGGSAMPSGMGSSARKVYQTIKETPQMNEGLHAQDIAARCGLELTEVLKAGDELQSLGLIYTTVDDLTWALLDMN